MLKELRIKDQRPGYLSTLQIDRLIGAGADGPEPAAEQNAPADLKALGG
jgi:hypothetical protein